MQNNSSLRIPFDDTLAIRPEVQRWKGRANQINYVGAAEHIGGLSTFTGLCAQLWHAATNTLLPLSLIHI